MSYSINEDKYSTQGMRVDIEISGNTENDVLLGMENYLRSYHPIGYDTSFGTVQTRDDGTFFVWGTRAHSCD